MPALNNPAHFASSTSRAPESARGDTSSIDMAIATRSTDWNAFEEFFEFTRGRFVVAERDQMARRRVRFDMNELVKIAARSVGASHCVSVQKCPDGMYSKCFQLTLDDGQEVIAKIPNPNAGRAYYTAASEVATMDFVSASKLRLLVMAADIEGS
jgi:hypothetical protein